jgi:hypothetical protein
MALNTYSKFYFGWTVTESSKYIDFNEGASELSAELQVGSYNSSSLATEIKRAMEEAGALTYTVSFNRSTRKFTISAGSNFALLTTTGSHLGALAFDLIGYTGADKTVASSYVADAISGGSYSPQFKLQSYISSEHLRRAIDVSVNKTTSGRVEVVSFGQEKFMECEIKFITDIAQSGPIVNNESGVADYLEFIRFAITKGQVEFMADQSNVDTYEVFILESTEDSSDGTGYRLIEEYDRGLAGYYRSGKLKFRVFEE